MRKITFSPSGFVGRISLLFLLVTIFSGAIRAQVLVRWSMNSTDKYNPTPASIATNVIAGAFSADPALSGGFSNTSGFKIKQSSSWPQSIPAGNFFNVDFPISSKTGFDLTFSSISFATPTNTNIAAGMSFLITPYYQVDGKGSWMPINTTAQTVNSSSTTVTFSNVPLSIFNNHKYIIRLYITSPTGADKTSYFNINNVVFSGSASTAAAVPIITLASVSKSLTSPKYAATALGSYTVTGSQPVLQSGVCWTTSSTVPAVASLSTRTSDGSNGVINSNITGLNAAQTYYVRAYAITQMDTVYSSQTLPLTTDPASAPILSTVTASNILSSNVTTGGNISDSGGVSILQEGVCWSTIQGAETVATGNNFTKDGSNGVSFNSVIKLLQPSTTYYIKAYAINSQGTSYGNEITITTSTAVPVISAIPSSLSFPTVVINAPSSVRFYSISGSYLSPAAGIVTITPPAGFSISTSSNSGFVSAPSTLTLSYNNGVLNSTKIFVKQLSTAYGNDTGKVLISGGGVVNPNVDSVTLTGSVIPDPNVLTNLGTDFWVGHGLEEKMATKIGTPPIYGLQLYVATGAQASSITVSIPGIPSFTPLHYNIPANSVKIVTGFPTGDPLDATNAVGLPDCRLYYTGVSNRGIHVEVTNNVPVALFLYDYATNNSAGGSMVFPTNTWNSSYIVQTYGGSTTNTGTPNTYFFVMAKEDNTVVTFKPTAPIIDSLSSPIIAGKNNGGTIQYAANTTTGYQITLNKGQIFNAVGLVDATTGKSYDLTGTTVTSDCSNPISVFAGNSRTLIDGIGSGCTSTQGSDNLIQQMFPKVAWGTKYLTVPTKSMEYNLFRIAVQDPATVVKVDGVALTKTAPTWNATGSFYQIEGNKYRKIESDIPINVSQFILPGSACGGTAVGNNGTGDPEMIILSPVQQAINSATVYMSDFKDGAAGGTYINVVIPTSGVASFKLDPTINKTQMVDTGTSSFLGAPYGSAALIPIAKAFKPHPQDANYSFAKFHVSYLTNPVHTLSSDVGFNAIAYGVANGESWGYNAGTAIKDLTAIVTATTPYGASTSAMTCKGNSSGLNISLPYDPLKVNKIVWASSNDPSVSPTNDIANGTVISTGSFVKDGVTYYTYPSPKNYTFDSIGTFKFTVTASGTFTNECGGSKTFDVVMTVVQDTADFNFASQSCGSLVYNFTDHSNPVSGNIFTKWEWSFGTGTRPSDSSYLQNPPSFTFPSKAQYQVSLRVINNIGCFSDVVKTVDLTGGMVAKISTTNTSVCFGNAIIFDGSSSVSSSGTITKYNWDYGDGTKETTTVPTATHTYSTAGNYNVTLVVATDAGCTSNSDLVSVTVAPIPVADFVLPQGVCLPGSTTFTNKSDVSLYGQLTYAWDFGDGLGTSTDRDPIYTYAAAPTSAGYPVKLIVTSAFGCPSLPVVKSVTKVFENPKAIIIADSKTCIGDSTSFKDASTVTGSQIINKWKWDFGDGTNGSDQNLKHKYLTVNSFNATLVVTTDQGCVSATSSPVTVKMNPLPQADFSLPGSCIGNGSVTFTDLSTISPDDGTQKPFTYLWTFGDASSNTSTDQNAMHTYTGTGSFQVKQTVTSQNGCLQSMTKSFVIAGSKPKPSFAIVNVSGLCSNLPVQLTDNSRIDLGAIDSVVIVWDLVNNPTDVQTDNKPSNGAIGSSKSYTHSYPVLSTDKSYTIQLAAYTGSTCFDIISQTITVHGTPKVSFANQSDICASAAPISFLQASETTGNFIGNGGFTYSGVGVNNINYTFDPSKVGGGNSGTIKAIYTSAAGCKDSANSTVKVLASVDLSFNPNKIKMCKTDSVQLTPDSKAGVNYSWTESDGKITLSDLNIKAPKIGPLSDSTVYTVLATNPTYCSSSASITVFASPYPKVKITSPLNHQTTICFGATVKLNAQTTSPNIVWSPDTLSTSNTLANVIANPYDTLTYTVKVTDNSYCTKSDSDFVRVNVLPKFSVGVRVGKDTSTDIVPNEPVQLYAYIVDTAFHSQVKYNWKADPSTTNYLSGTIDIADPILTLTNPLHGDSIKYTVTATTVPLGCEADTDFVVKLFHKPALLVATAFLPNSRIQENRVLIVNPVGITHFQYFKVYNRNGQQVFSTTEIGKGWDGTFNGQPADTGTYVWIAAGTDFNGTPHTNTGTVVLIR